MHFKELIEAYIKDTKTVEDMQGTEDFLYALTPAMEKVFGKGKVKHNWRMEFPSVLGKTTDGVEFIFGIVVNADSWKSLSFQIGLDNGGMLMKDVTSIKDSDTVREINTKAYAQKRDLLQEFKDLQTVPGTADEIQELLIADGYKTIG